MEWDRVGQGGVGWGGDKVGCGGAGWSGVLWGYDRMGCGGVGWSGDKVGCGGAGWGDLHQLANYLLAAQSVLEEKVLH